MSEQWRPVLGYEGRYSVSDQGRVWSHLRNRILKIHTGNNGYLKVTLTKEGARAWGPRTVHSLMLEAFIGPAPAGMIGRHIDDDKTHNMLENLCYGTDSDNKLDAVRNGKHGNARKTHCKRGHEYTPANTMRRRDNSSRQCRACKNEHERASRRTA